MGNRVLRLDKFNYPVEKFLRIVFRDDDGSCVHSINVGDALVNKFVGMRLRKGIFVAGLFVVYFIEF